MVNISQNDFGKVTPEIVRLRKRCVANSCIEKELIENIKLIEDYVILMVKVYLQG